MSRRPLAPRTRPAPPEPRAPQQTGGHDAPGSRPRVADAAEGPVAEVGVAEVPAAELPGAAAPARGAPTEVAPAEPPGGAAPAARPAQDGLPPRPRAGASPAVPGRPRAGAVHLRRSTPRSSAPPSGEAPSDVLRARRRTDAGAVSAPDTARRFAERARRRRRSALAPVLAVLAVLVVAAALAYAVLWSPLLVVREVGVVGLERLDQQVVADVVEPVRGTPLARVDTGSLEEELEAVPLVESAVVARVWPSGLEVRVVERVPVAAVAAAGGGYAVVDRSGQTVLTSPEPPDDVPLVEVDLAAAGPATVAAVTQVLDELPVELRAEVASAGGTSRDDVVLELRSGARVVWGGADSTLLKAEVLEALLQRPAAVYDVSSPGSPVTRAG